MVANSIYGGFDQQNRSLNLLTFLFLSLFFYFSLSYILSILSFKLQVSNYPLVCFKWKKRDPRASTVSGHCSCQLKPTYFFSFFLIFFFFAFWTPPLAVVIQCGDFKVSVSTHCMLPFFYSVQMSNYRFNTIELNCYTFFFSFWFSGGGFFRGFLFLLPSPVVF